MFSGSSTEGGRARRLRRAYVRPETLETRTAAWLAAIEAYARHAFRAELLGKRPGLLVLDLQRFFLEPGAPGYLPAVEAVGTRMAELLRAFRARGLPVVFTRHTDLPGDAGSLMERWWGTPMDPGDPRCALAPGFRPEPGEAVLEKHRYSAFPGTGLEEGLRRAGVTALVVCGVMTHLCCESTVRDAFQRGFPVVIAADGTADLDEELHVASLRALAHGFAVPARVEEVVWALRG